LEKELRFFSKNTWSEYVVVDALKCIDIGTTDFDYAFSCFVNPLSILAFIEIATAASQKYIIHTAAAGALGKMFIRYAKSVGVEVICIVRKNEQMKVCTDEGAKYVLNSEDPKFIENLREVTSKTQCKIAFDAVAGETTGKVLAGMPDGSTIYVYGGLSESQCVIGPRDLIFKNKTVKGFWATEYTKTKYSIGLLRWTWIIVPLLPTLFKTNIKKKYSIDDAVEALVDATTNPTDGKVIFSFD